MSKKLWCVFTGLCSLLVLSVSVVPAGAQMTEVKPKPPMYSYIANWQFPRASFADVEKTLGNGNSALEKAYADGTIIGYGYDKNLVHSVEGETHDTWWSAMSLAGLMKALDAITASGIATSPAMANPTKHWDNIYVSRYYNWKPGSYKDGYVHVSVYKLKADAPDDAVAMLAEHLIVPMLEKQIADGVVTEYEIDTMAIHTDAPGTFALVYVTATPEGLDTVQKAVIDSVHDHPLGGQAFGSMTEDSGHRDELLKGNGTFK